MSVRMSLRLLGEMFADSASKKVKFRLDRITPTEHDAEELAHRTVEAREKFIAFWASKKAPK